MVILLAITLHLRRKMIIRLTIILPAQRYDADHEQSFVPLRTHDHVDDLNDSLVQKMTMRMRIPFLCANMTTMMNKNTVPVRKQDSYDQYYFPVQKNIDEGKNNTDPVQKIIRSRIRAQTPF